MVMVKVYISCRAQLSLAHIVDFGFRGGTRPRITTTTTTKQSLQPPQLIPTVLSTGPLTLLVGNQ